MEIVTLLFILLIVSLVLENWIHARRLKKIPLRITVTGTRGKSSIVRTLASVFRSHGIQVLAKTTGSEATYILPDGKEEAIKRRGKTTILEQKKLIRKAVKLNVQCMITEIMSIHPECHSIETHKIIKPEFTILANIRADHIHLAGKTKEELSHYFNHDIYRGSHVFIHVDEINEYLISGASRRNAKLITVTKDAAQKLNISSSAANRHLPENLDLVYAASKHFGIDQHTIERGIENTLLDIGRLELFRFEEGEKKIFFVNTFAANEPESTLKLIHKITGIMRADPLLTSGLLALRSDRGERSRQWLDYLVERKDHCFHPLFLTGAHSRILHRKIAGSKMIRGCDPEYITRSILSVCDTGTLVFGMGNFHGVGKKMVEYWKEEGLSMKNERNVQKGL